MATDNSPPRTRLIAIIAFGTVVTLVGLKPIFDSYFTDMMEGEAKAEEKVAHNEEMKAMRNDELAALTTGSHAPASDANKVRNVEPIAQAIHHFATTPRDALPAILPQPSDNTGPLVGWAKGTKALAAAAAPPPAPTANTAPTDAADGGGLMVNANDGGPPPSTLAADAGSQHAPPRQP